MYGWGWNTKSAEDYAFDAISKSYQVPKVTHVYSQLWEDDKINPFLCCLIAFPDFKCSLNESQHRSNVPAVLSAICVVIQFRSNRRKIFHVRKHALYHRNSKRAVLLPIIREPERILVTG